MRLKCDRSNGEKQLQVQYYLPKNITVSAGAGRQRELLKGLQVKGLQASDLELLPG